MTELEKWLKEAETNKELNKGLSSQSKKEREEAFSDALSFGTGGIRGIIGYGPNRMNIYTIRKANYGLGKYLVGRYKGDIARGVVISHDNRNMSREFAIESAKVLSMFGIKCFMFDALRTTPELSFAVRFEKAIAGIMITASHNPAIYNGYKVYDEDGCQFTPQYADKIVEEVEKVEDIFSIPVMEEKDMRAAGFLKILSSEVDDEFRKAAESVLLFKDIDKEIKIVYTPLHGTGAEVAEKVLKETGFNAYFVKEQMIHDPLFKTVKLPNPEDPNAFKLAEALGKQENADLLIATDPDADRVGIGVKHNGKYVYLTGNQTGALLLYFRLKQEKSLGILPKKGRVFNTIVTSDLGAKIAQSYGFKVTSTLTGFKYIGEQAKLLEKTNEEFIFGYEESYGYIIKDYVRDKDSIQSLLAIAEMANYYLVNEQRDLVDILEEVYENYGYYLEYTRNTFFEGVNGKEKMTKLMQYFRTTAFKTLGGLAVLVKEDYLERKRYQIQTKMVSKLGLPESDVIKFFLEGESWLVIRPSGTEPKLKVYYSCRSNIPSEAKEIVDRLDKEIVELINKAVE